MIDDAKDHVSSARNIGMDSGHTLKALDRSLSELMSFVVQIGDYVSAMVEKSVQIFLQGDLPAANQFIHDDLQVDSITNTIIDRTLDARVSRVFRIEQ
ncbi:MAG: PhoU domain-containing protein [Gallionella sp.]